MFQLSTFFWICLRCMRPGQPSSRSCLSECFFSWRSVGGDVSVAYLISGSAIVMFVLHGAVVLRRFRAGTPPIVGRIPLEDDTQAPRSFGRKSAFSFTSTYAHLRKANTYSYCSVIVLMALFLLLSCVCLNARFASSLSPPLNLFRFTFVPKRPPPKKKVYERAIANVPPVEDKRYWRRYIYLWINYALFEELQAEDTQRTRRERARAKPYATRTAKSAIRSTRRPRASCVCK